MPSSFVSTTKYFLAPHYSACRPFFLLGSWASLVAFMLMLVCIYPYPVTVTELATVFLKLLFLANAVVLAVYLFFVTVKLVGLPCVAWLRNKAMAKLIAEDGTVPDLFPSLSVSSPMLLAESI